MTTPGRLDLENAARQFFDQLIKDFDQPRQFLADDFDNQVAHQLELSRERIADIDRQLITSCFDRRIVISTSAHLDDMGTTLEALNETDQRYALQLTARAERASLELFTHQLLKPTEKHVMRDELFCGAIEGAAPVYVSPVAESSSAPLVNTINRYLERLRNKKLSQSTVDETDRVLDWLTQRAGNQRRLGEIDKAEMRRFRDDIERLDGSLQGRKAPC